MDLATTEFRGGQHRTDDQVACPSTTSKAERVTDTDTPIAGQYRADDQFVGVYALLRGSSGQHGERKGGLVLGSDVSQRPIWKVDFDFRHPINTSNTR